MAVSDKIVVDNKGFVITKLDYESSCDAEADFDGLSERLWKCISRNLLERSYCPRGHTFTMLPTGVYRHMEKFELIRCVQCGKWVKQEGFIWICRRYGCTHCPVAHTWCKGCKEIENTRDKSVMELEYLQKLKAKRLKRKKKKKISPNKILAT